MREIKFRGMCANGIMRYGRLSQDKPSETVYYDEYSQRICWDNSNIPVSNKTLGQYTGLNDKNGKDIYEGDIVYGSFRKNMPGKPDLTKAKISFYDGCYYLCWIEDNGKIPMHDLDITILIANTIPSLEVIGNIYENKNLLN